MRVDAGTGYEIKLQGRRPERAWKGRRPLFLPDARGPLGIFVSIDLEGQRNISLC